MKTLFFFTILIFVGEVFAQQSLLLINGKEIGIQDLKIDSLDNIFYKNKRGKIKELNIDEVFSWKQKDSLDVIFYDPACSDECFTVEQMNYFLKGRTAGRNHKTYWNAAGGFVSGTVSGIFLATYLAPIIPAGFSGFSGAIEPKAKNMKIPEVYKDNRYYVEGYKKSVKHKRIMSGIIGGGAGIIAGIFIRSLLFKK